MVILARRYKHKITDFYAVIIGQIIIALISFIKGNAAKDVFRLAAFCFAIDRWVGPMSIHWTQKVELFYAT